MAVAGPERSGSGTGVPVPSSTTRVRAVCWLGEGPVDSWATPVTAVSITRSKCTAMRQLSTRPPNQTLARDGRKPKRPRFKKSILRGSRATLSNPKVRLADNTAGNLRDCAAAFAGSVKAITESLCYGLISDSPVNGIRPRVAQVRVENAPIPTVAKMFRQRMNAGSRVAVLSLLGWRINPRQANYALRRFAANSHRCCLSVLFPQPDLSSAQRPVYATLGVACRLPNFILKGTGPENHQTAIPRTCLA